MSLDLQRVCRLCQGAPHPTIKTLRAYFLNVRVLKEKALDWAPKVPYDVRDEAARDFMKAVESNKAKQQEKPDHHFGVRFRSRKQRRRAVVPGISTKQWAGRASAS